jgi:hypothetical protein
MFVDRAPPPPQVLLEIEHNGEPTDKVDLLLIGDGYTTVECAAKFLPDARRMAAALFRHEPFAARRRDFNVWGLCPPSAESGVARPSTGTYRRTAVGAAYDAFGAERYVLTFDNRAVRDVAAWAPYEFLTILVNGKTYGGGGIFGTFSTVAVDSDWAEYLFVHEFGHHFAALADSTTLPAVPEPATRIVEPWEPNVTTARRRPPQVARPGRPQYAGADTVAKQDSRSASVTSRLGATDPRGALFESEMTALSGGSEQPYTSRLLSDAAHGRGRRLPGANYDARLLPPQLDCVMFTRDEVPFCSVCQRALDRVIDQYAGPSAGR